MHNFNLNFFLQVFKKLIFVCWPILITFVNKTNLPIRKVKEVISNKILALKKRVSAMKNKHHEPLKKFFFRFFITIYGVLFVLKLTAVFLCSLISSNYFSLKINLFQISGVKEKD